jgi:hypothetical protein
LAVDDEKEIAGSDEVRTAISKHEANLEKTMSQAVGDGKG